MKTWGAIARMIDMGEAWGVARQTLRKGGALSSFSAYFSGMNMQTYAQSMAGIAARRPSLSHGQVAALAYRRGMKSNLGDLGTAAVRMGVAGAGLAGAGLLATRTETGRRVMRTAAPIAGGVAMYKGLKYGMSKWPQTAWGGQFMQNSLYRRGIATVGGLGTWYGLR